MEDARRSPLSALRSQLALLAEARPAVEAGEKPAIDSVRRLAGAVARGAASRRMNELARAARRAEEAHASDLLEALGELAEAGVATLAAADEAAAVVLVVEDDVDMALAIQNRLQFLGAQLVFADSAEQARRVLDERQVDLVILDLGLPGEDGRSLLAGLRGQELTERLPVVVFSAEDASAIRQECFALGADDYFVKPMDLNVVAAAVGRQLDRGGHGAPRLDVVTALPGPEVFREQYDRTLSISVEVRSPLALAILQLDGYETAGRSGLAERNRMLARVATCFRRGLRRGDVLAVTGPGEFAALFPGSDQDATEQRLLRMREALRDEAVPRPDEPEAIVSFSAGVVAVHRGMILEESFALAGRYVYLAQVRGGDAVLKPQH